MDLQPYCLVEFGKHGEKKRLERFIKPHPNRAAYYFILAEGKKAIPYLLRKNELDYALEYGMARIVEDDFIIGRLRGEHALGDREKLRVEQAWRVVKHLVAEDDIFDPISRGDLVRAAVTRDVAVTFSSVSFLPFSFERLVKKIVDPNTDAPWHKLSRFLADGMDSQAKSVILNTSASQGERRSILAGELNRLIEGPNIYEASGIVGFPMTEEANQLLEQAEIAELIRSVERDEAQATFKIAIC
jgi:hypothetical protein